MLSFAKEKLNMPDMYADGIARGQDKTFVVYQRFNGNREEYTFNQIDREAANLLVRLKEAGLKKGDRIAVVSALRPWWFALTYACLKGEFIMVCIDPGVPASQLQKMMLETEVRAVFTSLNNIHLPSGLEGNIPVYSIDANFPLMSKTDKVNFLLESGRKMSEDTFFILFSSGTTSENRKAVLLPHSTVTKGIEYGMSKDAGIYKNTTAYTPCECDLMLFPPYHIAGLLCATYDIYCNTKIIMLERLTPNGLVSALQDLKPDNICTVPSMLTSLYKKIVAGYSKKILLKTAVNTLLSISGFLRKNFGIKAGRVLLKSINKKAFGGNMKGFMIGASPIDYTTNKYFLDMGINVSMAYGLTELGAPLATTGQGYYPGTAGRVIKHNDDLKIRIVNKDENGRGEVEVLSPYRMITYYNPKDNLNCFTDDNYFKTGDLGYFDSNNCLVICGRAKETIVLKNGEKLLPEEIESKYQDLYAIQDMVAFKVPGDGGCDDFAIGIIKKRELGIPDDATKQFVYERSATIDPIYRPKDVYVLKEFPLSSSHKVQRFRLTEMVVKGNSDPITDSSMIPIDEDELTSSLRKILADNDGAKWKTEKLTQGLLLNIDSLTTVNVYVAIQEKWGIDLFQTTSQPQTFGDLLDIIKNYNNVEKSKKVEIDLSMYPLPVSKFNALSSRGLMSLIKRVWKVSSKGSENIPSEGNFLFCSNHRTVLDPAYILSCLDKKTFDNTCVVGKAELANDKLLKNLVNSQNFIPIDRIGNSVKTLERCKELLLEGRNILIFPEGTNLQNNTEVFHLKDGAVKLSIATGKPIVPIYISGVAKQKGITGNFNLPAPSGKILINFGKAITPDNKSVEEYNDLLRSKIQELS